ncbi:YicC/YloC family endoribonuclease [Riemerella anatipestifer]|uniref:YicC/YloC family endoribonuclease n=1 Tax=Riemerella anatipestifer TaxID=34085 RepID=UPI001BDA4E5D|nr:YicC/YloC family endoribonuclease [Riemerella anatipestifer]MBT0552308.1 YicC family protein [Riemerella anatipestifer]MCE3025032.1 YicC family protein [Riemerella anatipestifer]MCU7543251.1 YicC family protein [Riemerella anatipestifer]MCU7560693.1 YicC family protein [Riemerella anatipestifer]MCW0514065.1 YicC family protein [Riemerella anatipestifer]
MTGFGRAEGTFENKKISIDIKSVNSKGLDISLRMPSIYREKEFLIKKIISETILRGKVDCCISIESLVQESQLVLNKEIIQNYIAQFKEVVSEDTPDFELLKMAMRLPDATTYNAEEISDEEWVFIEQLLLEAINNFTEFRKTEGQSLQEELQKNITNIGLNLEKVTPFEAERLVGIKEKYQKALQDFENVDETRFYQEMAYYTEKLDVSEEKVRLAQHLKYYQDTMLQDEFNGKKLGFIAQEIGREINTLGSKANHAEIQKLVVLMKDDLEKIKEQTLNVL